MSSSWIKSVLVTGANRGIGFEFVRLLTKLDSAPKRIYASAREPKLAQDLIKLAEANQSICIIPLDVTNDSSITQAYDAVRDDLDQHQINGLSMLINNSGVLEIVGSNLSDADRAVFQRTFDVNVTGVAIVTQTFLPLLQKAAVENSRVMIANISSGIGSIGAFITGTMNISGINSLAYRLSKTALNQLSKTLAVDLKEFGIIVVSINPGWTDTDMGKASGRTPSVSATDATNQMLTTLCRLTIDESGGFFAKDGTTIPY